jgi:hypothetical protein
VTVVVEDPNGYSADISDTATIRSGLEAVLSEPPLGPSGLPDLGFAGLNGGESVLLLLVGAGLLAGGAATLRAIGRRRGSGR